MATARSYIRDLAAACGEFGAFTTTDTGTAGSLVSSALLSTNFSGTSLEGMAILLESGAYAGEQRDVRVNGLTKTTGSLALAADFSGIVASGIAFSAYSRLPAYRRFTGKGYRECVNDALKRLWFEYTISYSGVSGQKKYTIDTDTYPWLTSADRIISVHRPAQDSDDDPPAIRRDAWEWLQNGETRQLYFRGGAPANTGQTFTVKLYRPANSRLIHNAVLRAVLTGTAVTSVTVEHGGYYTALPTIAPDAGGATFTAVMAATPGPITSVTVDGGGTSSAGFPPTLTVTRDADDTGWHDVDSQDGGLIGLADEALSDLSDVTVVGKALVYRALAEQQAHGNTVDAWKALAFEWEGRATRLRHLFKPSNRASGIPNLRSVPVGDGRYR